MDAFLDGPWAYLVLLVAAFAENSVGVGLLLPVETLIVAAASLCATGHLSAPLVIVTIVVGAVAGDSVGYLIGRRFGPTLTAKLTGHVGITEERIAQAHRAFARWGMWAVAVARLVPVVRFLVVLLAGDLRLPYRRFVVADLAGIVVWVAIHFTFGYVLGSSMSSLGGPDELVAVFAICFGGTLAVGLAVRWWSRHRARRAAMTATASAP
jgi:membrane protein DedA with SNARE-associated domain